MEKNKEWCERCNWTTCRHNEKEDNIRIENLLFNKTILHILSEQEDLMSDVLCKLLDILDLKNKLAFDGTMFLKLSHLKKEHIDEICIANGIAPLEKNFLGAALKLCQPVQPAYIDAVHAIQKSEGNQQCFEAK